MTILHAIDDFDLSGDRLNEPLPLLSTTKHGVLSNGCTYYVRYCSKPKQRAALKLILRVGSILEEEHERGVAHILEHLAFNASGAYANHEVVQRLESLGLAFGPCQNAYTSIEETSYELLIPTDDWDILKEALGILREFAFGIRCGDKDLEKERGPVLEEWRAGRDATGRAAEAHWQLMLKGSKYADRLPIGLESVIRNCSADVVRAFYEKWYRPEHMAVIAVGDFKEIDQVVETIRQELGDGGAHESPTAEVPRICWHPHSDIHCKVFTDREMPNSLVYVHYKQQALSMKSPADYLASMKVEMLHLLMNRRFLTLSRKPDADFYSVSVGKDGLVRDCTAHYLEVTPFEGKLLTALEAALVEIARVRLHGLSQQELDLAKAEYLMGIETLYLERDQEDASDVAAEYARHFTREELVIGPEAESRLCNTIIGMVTVDDLLAAAQTYRSTESCVIKVMQHANITTEAEILQVVQKVDAMEQSGEIEAREWVEAPEQLLAVEPTPGSITSERAYEALKATELTLSNGMRVCYRCSDLLADQVLFSGFAAGGLSQLPTDKFRHARFAPLLATELGMFGFKPHILQDVLVGKRVDVVPSEGAYWRTIGGEQSPHDLDVAMQLLHKLFTHQVVPEASELRSCLLMARQMIQAQLRNPLQQFVQKVRLINYGSAYFKPANVADVDRLDVDVACSHFNESFQNPAQFTLCFVGNFDEDSFKELTCRYLASIPPQDEPPPLAPANVLPLDFHFPKTPVNDTVFVQQQEPITQVQLTFPVEMALDQFQLDGHWIALISKVVEARLMRRLRFEAGDVYSCSCSVFFGCEAPGCVGSVRGDLAVSFTCAPGRGKELAQAALSEVLSLQNEGPTEAEVKTALTIEQRDRETLEEDNQYWMTMLIKGYQTFTNTRLSDPDEVHRNRMAARKNMHAHATPATFKQCMCRLLPSPCTSRYTIVTTTTSTLIERWFTSHRRSMVVTLVASLVCVGLWFAIRSRHT